jgi:hypothetical protein
VSTELAFKLKFFNDTNFYNQNTRNPSIVLESRLEDYSHEGGFLDTISPKIFLIGDSFFDTDYIEDGGYVKYFEEWSKDNGYEFINLALAGTDILDHASIWSKIPDYSNHIYFYSIKVHDVEKDIPLKNNIKQIKGTKEFTKKQKFIEFISKSDVIYFFKDILHQTFMKLYHTPLNNTHLSKVLVNPDINRLKYLNQFLNILDKKKGKVHIVINYPFNFKYDINELKKWKLFNFFNRKFKNLNIIQTPLIENGKESVDWRNIHPNEIAVKNIFSFMIQEIKINSK